MLAVALGVQAVDEDLYVRDPLELRLEHGLHSEEQLFHTCARRWASVWGACEPLPLPLPEPRYFTNGRVGVGIERDFAIACSEGREGKQGWQHAEPAVECSRYAGTLQPKQTCHMSPFEHPNCFTRVRTL